MASDDEMVKACPDCDKTPLAPRQSTEHDYYCPDCRQPVFEPVERKRQQDDHWTAEAVLKNAVDRQEVSN